MTHTTIAANIHQTLDVQLDFGTKVTLHFELSADNFTDLGSLVVSPLVDLQVTANTGFIQYLC